jgi:hypothetical protein
VKTNDANFPAGAIAEVTTDKPEEYEDVPVGARGIVTGVEGKKVHATWVKGDESHGGFIYKEHLKLWKPSAPPVKDIRAFLCDIANMLEIEYGHRKPSVPNAQKMLELGASWKGSTQCLYELMAWIDQSPETWAAFDRLNAKWIGGFKELAEKADA